MSRREFVGAAGLAAAAIASPFDHASAQAADLRPPRDTPDQVAKDEVFWQSVALQYRISPLVTNLENGYWGVMAQPVLDAYKANIDRVNAEGVYYIRNEYVKDLDAARARVAAALGADVAEVAFTRGATEAMQVLIGGYNRLEAGDAVMYADLDYLERTFFRPLPVTAATELAAR